MVNEIQLTDYRNSNEEDCIIEGLILTQLITERKRQQEKWGLQTHSISEWLMILGEEYGEACKAGNESYFREYPLEILRKELIHTMAVALAIIEGIDHT